MLRRIFGAGLLLAVFAVLAPAPGLAQKKDAKPGDKTVPTVDADKLQPGEFTGKLQRAPASDGSFTIRVEYKHVQVDQKAVDKHMKAGGNQNHQLTSLVKEQQHIAQLQMDLQRARTPYDLAHKQQQLVQAVAQFERTLAQAQQKTNTLPANAFKTVTDSKDIEFHAAAEVKVRTLNLPETFDEKGNVKKYTREELDAAKGKDKNLPGYESSVDKLQPGQTVKVTVAVNRPARPAEKKEDPKPDEKKEDPRPARRRTKSSPPSRKTSPRSS